MDTILKWLNKPKADDKSLLARFFHADRALAAVASELDSFDGRAEPDRCSRLVSRLRQGQDKVLAITNLIIEELLGDERDQRAFRAKFPEEVLQENLAGQLWFGAECLAAGSSIMNREQESKEMRPLAEAVTRSLNNVRHLLRDQCLRNNVPNSERLNLDKNDAATEQLYESLKRFDRLFAEFEWRYVSAMVQVKSKEEYEMQELICVLCSETLQRALKLGLLEQEQVDAFDPALMFSIPRLAIVAGLVIYPDGPLNMDMPAEELSEMFRPFRSLLIKVREYLRNLNETELFYLERLLCTNEEISLKDTLKAKQTTLVDNNNETNTSKYCGVANSEKIDKEDTASLQQNNTTSKLQQQKSCKTFKTKNHGTTNRRADSPSPAPSTSSSSDDCSPYTTPLSSTPSSPRSTHSMASTTTAEETSGGTTSPDSWMANDDVDVHEYDDHDHDDDDIDAHYADDDDSDINCDDDDSDDDEDHVNDDHLYDLNNVVEQIINLEIASADCASGYLISNTTLGNLLQPQEVPLTDNFVVSDSDLPNQDDYNDNHEVEMPSTSARAFTSAEQTERQEQQHTSNEQANRDNNNSAAVATNSTSLSLQDSDISVSLQSSLNPSNSSTVQQLGHRRYSDSPQTCSNDNQQPQRTHHRHHHHHHRHHHHHHRHHQHNSSTTVSAGTAASSAPQLSAATANSRKQHHSNQSHHNSSTTTSASSSSTHCRRHHHAHHQRRPHRHGGDRHEPNATGPLPCVECSRSTNKPKDDVTISDSKAATSLGLDIETPSSSSSLLEDNKTVVRSGGRMKFKSTENLLHRLFVSIAGVADQLQTNFAFDLRQILRSVFLINMSPALEELDIPEKPKENELFEFRASENDVIQESAGSSQSIYSAEEVNPEGDNQSQNSNSSSNSGNSSGSSNDSNRVYRHSTGSTAVVSPPTHSAATVASAALQRQQIERSRSLDNQQILPSTHQNQSTPPPPSQHSEQNHQVYRNRHHSTGSSTTPSSSENNSPVCERSTTATTTGTMTATNGGGGVHRRVSESNANSMPPQQTAPTSRPVHLSPPAWIPDQKAPRCMSCNTPFTAFRRRHHCRNCGGVFCGVCSNTSAPLPKYGLTKAVRVCRACYVHELGPNSNGNPQNQSPQHHRHQHHQPHHQLVSQTATTNNEPSRLRRPVTTTRAFD
uniref:Lateral signaling target protein 2 homolog n=1 Tax=Musca domestica TaxID=7370 RepID=T1P8Q4_MUSDO